MAGHGALLERKGGGRGEGGMARVAAGGGRHGEGLRALRALVAALFGLLVRDCCLRAVLFVRKKRRKERRKRKGRKRRRKKRKKWKFSKLEKFGEKNKRQFMKVYA
jgi:hypothetical protein